ncbi:Predicted arabinose efflux permease, MFS family [Formosa sp. Hel1_31_208]|uniref:MFS transporter n=1 Tax=Formosa sp. Hel1_31_208 TaxID=1798225 RepID=UPI0008796530|nr:MFS transporter [Formosa sp. Hel1_31_208]SDS05520.1 Predicted arabinose efflux permease, MFS family [Formosa sp. Hel1_31_208]
MIQKRSILPIIVISQFCCTSLWFASNGVMNNLVTTFNLSDSAIGHLTSVIQFGFIIGTLVFAILTIADRFSPSKVFFVSALLGALFNVTIIWDGHTLSSLLSLRFLTGFCLAGIYPVGMKIAADYYQQGLGKSLGFLVGALVIGTAFPHLLKSLVDISIWKLVILITSGIAILGGTLMLTLVPNGPYRHASQGLDLSAFSKVFKRSAFRAAAFGYFGHMWELYAFWAFVPVMLHTYSDLHGDIDFNTPLLSFFIIGIGGLGCVVGGYLSQRLGTKQTAFTALLLSCICCIICPFLFMINSEIVFIGFLVFWGIVVIADSPLFSTLVAQNAQPEIKGTALTIVNCIGFSITIVSILLLTTIREMTGSNYMYMLLALGPVFGLLALRNKK